MKINIKTKKYKTYTKMTRVKTRNAHNSVE